MGFIIAIIVTITYTEVLVLLSLYCIPARINTNGLWRSKRLIVIYRIDIPLFNIKALILVAWFAHLAKK